MQKNYQNTGGRTKFDIGSNVLVVKVDGTIDTGYTVCEERSNRNGLVLVKKGTTEIRVHHRRVLPDLGESVGCVVESGGVNYGVCPKCTSLTEVGTSSVEQIICSNCKVQFKPIWLGARQMTTKTEDKVKKTTKKPAKADKPEVTKVDFKALAALENVELYTKTVPFDQPKIVARSHVLLFVGESPRKLCFNTYDGSLGRRKTELPVEDFLKNSPADAKRSGWYNVADVEKERTTLHKKGFKKAAAH